MKALVITPKNESELKFLSELLEKLGIVSSTLSLEDLEDAQMSKLLQEVDKTKRVSRAKIMKKLSA